MPEIKLLAGLQTYTLPETLIGAAGKVLAQAGDTIILLPQTLADCVQFPDGSSLAEKWPEASEIVGLGEEIIRCSTRILDTESALVGYSAALIRQANSLTDARLRLVDVTERIDRQSASTVSVIDGPKFSFDLLTENTGEIVFTTEADTLLKSGSIDKFYLTIPELEVYQKEFPANDNAAQISFKPFEYMSNQELNISIVAQDCYGNTSRAVTQKTTLVIYGIQPPIILSPLENDTVATITPDIILEPMQIIGELTDKTKYVRVQIAEDTSFEKLVFDNGVATAPTENNIVPVYEGLEAGKTYFVRARWTGEFLGASPWSKTVCFMTMGNNDME